MSCSELKAYLLSHVGKRANIFVKYIDEMNKMLNKVMHPSRVVCGEAVGTGCQLGPSPLFRKHTARSKVKGVQFVLSKITKRRRIHCPVPFAIELGDQLVLLAKRLLRGWMNRRRSHRIGQTR